MRVRTSLFQRGMEAYEKVKSHTANKQDLALVLRLLSDREAIRRGLGKTAGGDFESRYLSEEIIDELTDSLLTDKVETESTTEEESNKFDPILNYIEKQGICLYELKLQNEMQMKPEDICRDCKYFGKCKAINQYCKPIPIEPIIIK